jgi:hypothetical protein
MVADLNLTQKNRASEVYAVVKDQPDLQAGMGQTYTCHQRLRLVYQFSLPLRGVQPGKLTINPDACVRNIPIGMQFLPHVRPVYIAEIIPAVKIQ